MTVETFLKAKELNEMLTREMVLYKSLDELYKNSQKIIVTVHLGDPGSYSYNFPLTKELYDLIEKDREGTKKEIERMKKEFEEL